MNKISDGKLEDIVTRLRIGKPSDDHPDWEVVWVQNLRAHFEDGMFSRRAFPEWVDIFSENFEALLLAATEAADYIEMMESELAALRSKDSGGEVSHARKMETYVDEYGSTIIHDGRPIDEVGGKNE